MEELLIYILVGIIIIIALYIFYRVSKKLIVNSIIGLILLFILNYGLMMHIPITPATILVTALFGLAGVGSLAVLNFFGMI